VRTTNPSFAPASFKPGSVAFLSQSGAIIDSVIDWAAETLRLAVARGEARRVTLCFEPLAPVETNFINTAAEAIRFVQRLNSPNLQIILDVKAMCSESRPIPQIIRESWPHFAHFHANDRNLKGPGFGEVDFRPIAADPLEQLLLARTNSVDVPGGDFQSTPP
jgi:sugar phosphate isomerase/epimerase